MELPTLQRQNESQASPHSFVNDSHTFDTDLRTPTTDSEDLEDEDEAIPLTPTVTKTLVDTTRSLKEMIDFLKSLPSLTLCIDLEGEQLSKYGAIVTLQLLMELNTGPRAFIVDVWVLKARAFETPGKESSSWTFKKILEDQSIPKFFWDCRMDSEALYWQYGISLTSVIDLQLMEVASRGSGQSKRLIGGYESAVLNDITLNETEALEMSKIKNEVQALFIPDLGGSWIHIKWRPMSEKLLAYCVGDIKYMPMLYRQYAFDLEDQDLLSSRTPDKSGMAPSWESDTLMELAAFFHGMKSRRARMVLEESRMRILRSQREGWDREKDNMRLSPWYDTDFL